MAGLLGEAPLFQAGEVGRSCTADNKDFDYW